MSRKIKMENLAKPLAVSLSSYAFYRWMRSGSSSDLSKVPGPGGNSALIGHMEAMFGGDGAWDFHERLLTDYDGVVKVHGILNEAQLYISDPVALHHIINSGAFDEDSMLLSFVPIVFGPSFSGTAGEQHRRQRKMLSPVFSVQQIKGLVPVFYPIAYQLRDVFAEHIKSNNGVVDVFNWLSLTALEFIGRGGLGYSFDALNLLKKNEYNDHIKQAIATMTTLFPVISLLPMVGQVGPAWFRRKLVDWTPSSTVHRLRDISDVMQATSEGILEKKRAAMQEGEEALSNLYGNGKDIMTTLLKANSVAGEADKLPEEEILAQMNALIFAGQDTTSNAMSHMLHLLATHPEIQDKLREEILQAREISGGQDLDYEDLNALPYLDATVRETLRMYPPGAIIWRECVKDTVMPLQKPMKLSGSDKEITGLPVKKGSKVIISVMNANRDKRIWGEDAFDWNPERWLNPLPATVGKSKMPGIYHNTMSFLGGNRSCIGMKFAEIEMKMIIFVLLENFVFSIEKGTEIRWTFQILQQPSIVLPNGKVDPRSQLPLKITWVKDAKR
ncbi:cytochrome P450 [Schizopora paradoxa]|uniref:Cytochrome P450 n=1 Tax=Schizopora paradoxa TaxID=27342 RepID=A0A0H2RET6_9AGAM|nr:cytochrome P450 [Schizopora paradoxa]